jgi:hypothetical protein
MSPSPTHHNSDSVNIAVLQTDMSYIRQTLDEMRSDLNGKYVTKEQFDPVQKIVFGIVSLLLISVVGAILSLVLKGVNLVIKPT